MQSPISLMLRNGLHSVSRKLIAEVLVSSLSTCIALVLVSHLTKPAPSVALVDAQIASVEPGFVGDASVDATADFLERVALSHIASPKTAAAGQTVVAKSELPIVAAAPRPPRRPTPAQSHSLISGKASVAASVSKVESPGQSPLAASEPNAASAPLAADRVTPLQNPFQYGIRLVANVGDFVSASDKRLVDGMASVGDAVTSFINKLKS